MTEPDLSSLAGRNPNPVLAVTSGKPEMELEPKIKKYWLNFVIMIEKEGDAISSLLNQNKILQFINAQQKHENNAHNKGHDFKSLIEDEIKTYLKLLL